MANFSIGDHVRCYPYGRTQRDWADLSKEVLREMTPEYGIVVALSVEGFVVFVARTNEGGGSVVYPCLRENVESGLFISIGENKNA